MEQLIEEIKPIEDYEGLYSISNYGYVISEAKTWITGLGHTRRKDKTILSIQMRGYLMVSLSKNNILKMFKIHLLVWDHFGDKPRNGRKLQVDHKDENKLNCRIDNLQLLTSRQNISKSKKLLHKSSKYTGVSWDKRRQKWQAKIFFHNKQNDLGRFTEEYNAHIAYQKKIKEIEGEENGKFKISKH